MSAKFDTTSISHSTTLGYEGSTFVPSNDGAKRNQTSETKLVPRVYLGHDT